MCRVKSPSRSGTSTPLPPPQPVTPTPPSQPPPQPTWPYNDIRLTFYDVDIIRNADRDLSIKNGNPSWDHVRKAKVYAIKQVTKNKNGGEGTSADRSGLRFQDFGGHIHTSTREDWTLALAAEARKKGWVEPVVARVDSGVVVEREKSKTVSPSPPKSALKKRKASASEIINESCRRAKKVRIDTDETVSPSPSAANSSDRRTGIKVRFNMTGLKFLSASYAAPIAATAPEVQTNLSSDSEATITADDASETTIPTSSPCLICDQPTQGLACLCEDQRGLQLLILAAQRVETATTMTNLSDGMRFKGKGRAVE